jgi:hypothetical protein
MLLRGLNAAIVSMTRLIYFKRLLIPDVVHSAFISDASGHGCYGETTMSVGSGKCMISLTMQGCNTTGFSKNIIYQQMCNMIKDVNVMAL